MKSNGKPVMVTLVALFFSGASALAADRLSALETRLQKVENALEERTTGGGWPADLRLSGALEVEAGFTRTAAADPATGDTDASDVDSSKAELRLEADIAEHWAGAAVLLHEDDELTLDEGFITLSAAPGAAENPLFYLKAGKMVLPFGNYETRFISDPLTLDLGETNEGAAVIGFADDLFDFSLGVFNADLDETGDDDPIDAYVAAVGLSLPHIDFGASFISTLAEGGLEDDIAENAGPLRNHVPAYSLFASIAPMDGFFITGEYVAALEAFAAGESSFHDGHCHKPEAWHLELAYTLTERLETAVRYEGGRDGGDLIPENRYGAVVGYGITDHVTSALEYLHAEFENDYKHDAFVAQLAIEF